MSDVTLNCGFGCSSVDGCQGHCDAPAIADRNRNGGDRETGLRAKHESGGARSAIAQKS
jgi:hypothetical protein